VKKGNREAVQRELLFVGAELEHFTSNFFFWTSHLDVFDNVSIKKLFQGIEIEKSVSVPGNNFLPEKCVW